MANEACGDDALTAVVARLNSVLLGELQSKMEADEPPAPDVPSHTVHLLDLVPPGRAGSPPQPAGFPAISPDPAVSATCCGHHPLPACGSRGPLPASRPRATLQPPSPWHVTSGDALSVPGFTLPVLHLCHRFLRPPTAKSRVLVSVTPGSPCQLLPRASVCT